MVVYVFLPKLQFKGLYGSPGPSNRTICSLSVFKCSSRWVWGIARSGCLPRSLDKKDWCSSSSPPELGALGCSLILERPEIILLILTMFGLATRVRRKVKDVDSAIDDFLGFCWCVSFEHGAEASHHVPGVLLLSSIWISQASPTCSSTLCFAPALNLPVSHLGDVWRLW